MKILIVYGTTEGQTRKISSVLKEEAEKNNHRVVLYDAIDHPVSPEGFDAVLIGASLHGHKYQNALRHYVKEYAQQLNKIPTAFYSVSLTAASDDQDSWRELEDITQQFLEDAKWKPTVVEQIKGALLYSKYDFFKKFIMRMISKRSGGGTDTSHDYEYTDWDKLCSFLTNFLATAEKKEKVPVR